MSIAVPGKVTDWCLGFVLLGMRVTSAALQAEVLHQLWRRLLQWKQGYLHLVCPCRSNQIELLPALQLFVRAQAFLYGAHMLLECMLGLSLLTAVGAADFTFVG